MRVRVLAFARLRELLGSGAIDLDVDEPATVDEVWNALAVRSGEVQRLRPSTRIARNGRVVNAGEPLGEGDEIALLPPVGGG